ncbi:hypothetical protein D3C84_1258590 [compost metagenome]
MQITVVHHHLPKRFTAPFFKEHVVGYDDGRSAIKFQRPKTVFHEGKLIRGYGSRDREIVPCGRATSWAEGWIG